STGGNTDVNETISQITVNAGENSTDNNFGEVLPPPEPASISGFVYCDDNDDGVKDAGEVGLNNVTIQLLNAAGVVISTTTTAADGSYSFTGLDAGTYSVVEPTQPAGKNDGKETAGSTGGNTDVNETISQITVNAGENSTDNNFGEVLPPPDIDIEKFVRIEKPAILFAGAVCEVFGKPQQMTFDYNIGNAVDTDQDSSKAAILTQAGIEDDGKSYVVVTDKSNPTDSKAKVFFKGYVDVGSEFTASVNADADKFGSSTYVHFFDDNPFDAVAGGDALLQSLTYHTSCSQPIHLGDMVGNVTLVDYVGEDGAAPDSVPGVIGPDEDADVPSGPAGETSVDTAVFTYYVTNPGTVPLSNVVVTDDRIAAIEFIGGDDNNDGLLDSGETWSYTASELVMNGLQTNIGTVTGVYNNMQVTDNDPANYIGMAAPPAIDIEKYVAVAGYAPAIGHICDTLGKPLSMTFDYEIGNTVDTDQDSSKAAILTQAGIEDDGKSYVVVTDKSNPTDSKAKVFFKGYVDVGSEFTASVNADADKFGSATYVHFFDDNPFDAVAGGDALLQSLTYHTSCSQPINLGDTVGNVSLVGYAGEDGTIDPSVWFGEDADTPSGPEAAFGTAVDFTYVVTNPGSTPLANVSVSDDRLSNVTYVEGDTNADNKLDPGEAWIYTASETALVGQVTNTGIVTATPVDALGNPLGLPEVTDQDDANYIVVGGPQIDIEKYVAVAGYAPVIGHICDTLGKPLSMTFDYEIGNTVDTDQDSSKAAILTQAGIEDDGKSYVVVTDKSNPGDLGGKVFFRGYVNVGSEFTASVNADADKFGSATYVHFFDDNPFDAVAGGDALLQSLTYHTSCSQPINLGDTVGNVSLVGYAGEDGTIDPSVWFGEDADTGPGPQSLIGDNVDFTYVVTNPGSTPLANVSLTDNRLNIAPGFEGDANQNGLLDPGEEWIYTASELAQAGQVTNIATVSAIAVDAQGQDLGLPSVSDQDAANYNGVDMLFPDYDACDTLGKPKALKFDYEPSVLVNTAQSSDKAKILFDSGLTDDDGVSFILVTNKSNPTDLGGKEFFMGTVQVGDEFIASTTIAGDKFGSNTYVHVFDDNPFDTNGSNQLLQSAQYHTSCSQPIHLGDQLGDVTLVGFQGESGAWGI
ncbi:DUF7467 domain-containing protein, partial [Nitrosomonas aestuarii]|uniref:DUF7467 domain-containing protein n=1 Tax=Nitrosomonas aestuarii TaxID=52441 RepID=UPI000D4F279B